MASILDPALPCWDRWISKIVPLRLNMIWRTAKDWNRPQWWYQRKRCTASVIWRHLYNIFFIPRVLVLIVHWANDRRGGGGGDGMGWGVWVSLAYCKFQTEEGGVRVRLLWEKQYVTQIVRKSTPNFAKFLSLVFIRQIFTKRCMDCRISLWMALTRLI